MFTQDYVDDLVAQSIEKGKDYLSKENLINAETLLKQSRRVAPNNVKILDLLGLTLMKQAKFDDAIDVYNSLLKIEPDHIDGINNLAYSYSNIGNREEAIALLRRGISLNPKKDSLWYYLAIQYKDQGDFKKAFEVYEEALDLIHNSSDLNYHYGVALGEYGYYMKALEHYEIALTIDPSHAPSHWNKSLMLLLTGNYQDGFAENEWRFRQFTGMMKTKVRFYGKTEWNAVSGQGTVLFYNEQGMGDLLQMVRYMPQVKALGYNVLVEVPASMYDLVSQCEGVDSVVLFRSTNLPQFDYVASINSLPRLFETTLSTVPNKIPYLKPTGSIDPKEFKTYEGKKKIGICWAGGPYHATDHLRSCRLNEFKKINDLEDVKLFSLQKETSKRFHVGCGIVDLTENCDDMTLVDMSDLMHDFNHTAAIIDQLDLIISVDTAVAHLAGAMGKPCWVLVPALPDWRWGAEGSQTPWYPNTKIFRQKRGEKWSNVFDRVLEELKK